MDTLVGGIRVRHPYAPFDAEQFSTCLSGAHEHCSVAWLLGQQVTFRLQSLLLAQSVG